MGKFGEVEGITQHGSSADKLAKLTLCQPPTSEVTKNVRTKGEAVESDPRASCSWTFRSSQDFRPLRVRERSCLQGGEGIDYDLEGEPSLLPSREPCVRCWWREVSECGKQTYGGGGAVFEREMGGKGRGELPGHLSSGLKRSACRDGQPRVGR